VVELKNLKKFFWLF